MKDREGVPPRTLRRGVIFAVVAVVACAVLFVAWLAASGVASGATGAEGVASKEAGTKSMKSGPSDSDASGSVLATSGAAIADGDYYWEDGDRQAQLSLYRDGLMDPSDPDTAWVGIGEGTDWVYSFFFAWDDKTLSYEVYDRRLDSTGTSFLVFVPIDDESFRLTATGPGDGGEVVFDRVLTKDDLYPD